MAGQEKPFDPYHVWLGIPPKDQPPNHYRLLGLELFEDDPEVIDAGANRQTAYLQTMASGEHRRECAELLNEISQARICLVNSDRREKYDERLRAVLEPDEPEDDEELDEAEEEYSEVEPEEEDQPVSIRVEEPPAFVPKPASPTGSTTTSRTYSNKKKSSGNWSLVSLAVLTLVAIVIGATVWKRSGSNSEDKPSSKNGDQQTPTGKQEPFQLGNPTD